MILRVVCPCWGSHGGVGAVSVREAKKKEVSDTTLQH